MNTTQTLTARQQEVLMFIVQFSKKNGYPPTYREIAENLGSENPTAAVFTLQALEKKGYIVRTPRVSRGIKIVT